ncbi:FMN-linked oxidoreductase [Imleria badia]|nr:FMN-linked oxidoreductase [Imleria badia]
MASTQQTPALFKPIKVGRLTLQHPSYYSQRGSAPGTLLIAGGFPHVPGICTDEQIKVTDAVHAKGRLVVPPLLISLEKQDPPSPYVSASSVALTGRSKPPRPLAEAEIKDYIATYAKAASNVIHNTNGYLPDQFLQTMSNKRTDRWGGDEEGRTRFIKEIVDVVVDAVGQDRVGIRISPWSTYQDMGMLDPQPTFAYLLAYLHTIEPRVGGDKHIDQHSDGNNGFLREIWNGSEGGEERVFISVGGYTRETALRTAEDKGGLIAFGRLYISNVRFPTFHSSALLIRQFGLDTA